MNADQMLDYVLGQQAALGFGVGPSGIDGETNERVARLRASVDGLLDDGRSLDPPRDLVERTLLLVSRHREAAAQKIDWMPRRVPFRAADLAVAATILVAGLLTLAPAVVRMKAQMQTAQCMNQLRQVGIGLMAYSINHGHYPKPPANYPAGYYGIQLISDRVLDDPKALCCPAHTPHGKLLSLKHPGDYHEWQSKDEKACQEMLSSVYAYHAGYRTNSHEPRALEARLTSVVPLLGDGPPLDRNRRVPPQGNSPNHGGAGQNVLFSDNHVQWLRQRRIPPFDDDIYLNRHGRLDLGVHHTDASLLPATLKLAD